MKKALSLVAVAAIFACILCFAGCGSSETLNMATNATFPPYEYKDGEKYVGIDIEIAEKIAEKLGMELKVHDVEFGAIISGVESGKYDMGMAGMTVTPQRAESVNFTDSYATAVQSVIVKEDSPYTSFEEFYTGFDSAGDPVSVKDGITIGVQQNTTGDVYASDTAKKWGFEEKNVIRYQDGPTAVQALLTNKVTAVIIDNEPAKSYVAMNEGLKILEGAYTNEDYAICVAKDNDELLKKINDALNELIKDGTVARIVEKYIPSK